MRPESENKESSSENSINKAFVMENEDTEENNNTDSPIFKEGAFGNISGFDPPNNGKEGFGYN
jgi:hypothetical protein